MKVFNKISIVLLVIFMMLQVYAFVYQLPSGTEFFKFSMYHEVTYYQFEVYADGKLLTDQEFQARYSFQSKGGWRAIEHLFNGIRQHEQFYNQGEQIEVICHYTEDLDENVWRWSNR